ncbi:MAG TPA: biotin/lipoyl-binding protein [Solirubrobacteraceae bacterium]|jgi:multidrug efflux pump subunit AcrA (membrane-fusion protein)|nr:biotin/lipoyl-binding protein [Solirubrobacteraceae bacterium]
MNDRGRASWLVYALGALCAGAIVAAILVVGPASAGSSTVTRTATAATGLVQSTVSGSGNLAPASELDLGFKTSGTVTNIYVKQGQQVAKGQLLATLDPQSAEVTLQQARAGLQSAEANLASEEETDGEGSSGQSKGSGEATAKAAAAAPTATTPASGEATTTTPTATTPSKSTSARGTSKQSSGSSTSDSGSSASSATTISEATREANLASARAAVRSDRLTVQSDEQSVTDTKLYAPEDGTIASLSGEVGEVVSGGGTTRAASGESSSASTGASSASSSTKSAAGSAGASSSSFAVLSNLSSMRLVVPLSESEVGSVRAGQIATVTVEALEGKKLAAHVREVAILSTSNSGVVSYDVTFQVDQTLEGLKPGMSATAEVVIKQASGVNVPTSAISGGSVTVLHGSKRETRQVTTGLAGDSATIVASGLKAGETVLLPTATTTSSSSRSALSGLRSSFRGLGGAGGTGGGFGGAGGGAPGGGALLRGGG